MLTNYSNCPGEILSQTGVYAIVHTTSGKLYVGSTSVSFRNRWRQHLNYLRRGKHQSPQLQRAYDLHGDDAFFFQVIAILPKDCCIEAEQYYLDLLQPTLPKNGYNNNPVANSQKGRVYTKEQYEKWFATMTERGKFKHTEETKRKMSQTRKGTKLSEKHRLNVQRGQVGIARPFTTGEKNGNSKLTEKQVIDIWQDLQSKEPATKIAAKNGVHISAIYSIKYGTTWKGLTQKLQNSHE